MADRLGQRFVSKNPYGLGTPDEVVGWIDLYDGLWLCQSTDWQGQPFDFTVSERNLRRDFRRIEDAPVQLRLVSMLPRLATDTEERG